MHKTDNSSVEIGLLHTVTAIAVSRLDLKDVLSRALPPVLKGTGAEAAECWIFDPVTQLLELKVHEGEPSEAFFERTQLKLGEGLPGIAAQTLQPVFSSDLSTDPRFVRRRIAEAGFRVLLAMPLVFQGKPMGVLCVASRDRKFSGEHHTKLLARIADVLAIAVQNARLFAQVKQLARERGKLLEISERERQRLEILVNLCPAAVLVVDASGSRVVLLNREAQRLIGAPLLPGDLLETYEEGAIRHRGDGRPYAIEELPLRRALQRGERVLAEAMRIVYSDGRTVPVVASASPLYAGDGSIIGAVVLLQDVSPLEEVEKLRSEFLALVTRALKTPLLNIKEAAAAGWSSWEQGGRSTPHDSLRVIGEQADRLLEAVDNLLDMSSIETGSFTVNREVIDLRALLDEARVSLAHSAGRELQMKVPLDLPPVNADGRRIFQVLVNLLSNAAKFSPSSTPVAVHVEHDTTQVKVQVRDWGRGIPQEKLPYLFEKFSPVHPDMTYPLVGTGLGLAICKGIIEAHGGRIWAESPGEGQGATFTFTLPIAEAGHLPTGVDTSRRAQHLGRVVHAGASTRILIVDDDSQVRRYLQRHLADAGFHAVAVSDPGQIMEPIERDNADLILLNPYLAGGGGHELLTQIRRYSAVPIIVMGESRKTEDVVRALNSGADDHVTKPIPVPELLARINAVLRRRLMPDTIEPQHPVVLDGLIIDFAVRRVTLNGRAVPLSPTEYKVLYELARHAGQVLTHEQILRRVWGAAYSGETFLVRSAIRHLRRKLRDDSRRPRYVVTERAVGYRLAKS